MNRIFKAARLFAIGAVALAAALAVQSCQHFTGDEQLFLTLPFCLDRAMESSFNLKLGELRSSASAERQSHACFTEIKALDPALLQEDEATLTKLDAYLELALAVSASDESFEQTAKLLVARRIDVETSSRYFNATSLQKALNDAGPALPEEDAEFLEKEFAKARLDLLNSLCLLPDSTPKFDTDALDSIILGPKSEGDELIPPNLIIKSESGSDLKVTVDDALADAPKGKKLNPRRILVLASYKAAKNLLDPQKTGAGERMLYTALAKLAREGIAKAKLRSARDEFAKANIIFLEEAKRGVGTERAAKAIVSRDLALGLYCAAKEQAADPNGEAMLLNHGIAVIPDAPKNEPPDPTLIETPSLPEPPPTAVPAAPMATPAK